MERKRILLIDDDPEIRTLLTRYLTQKGYLVSCSKDGQIALKTAKQKNFDLIILDIMLPGWSGLEVCKKLRNVTPTPIILFTGSESEEVFLQGLEFGADDFIQKSSSMDIILAKIDAMIRRNTIKKKGLSFYESNYTCAQFSGWSYYPKKALLTSPEDIEIFLTDNENKLMTLLCKDINIVCLRETIAKWLNISSKKGFARSVDIIVCRLRNKLKKLHPKIKLIKTIRNKGYQLNTESIDYEE